jgi:hypothetical protein
MLAGATRKVAAMSSTIDTLLVLALPASGKSEVRRYLAHLDPDAARTDLRVGPLVQLDDYPYVHLMRRIDQEVRALGGLPVFFLADAHPMIKGRDWATLIALLNEDYDALGTAPAVPAAPTAWLLERFDRARDAAGLAPPFDGLPLEVISALAAALDEEVAGFARGRSATLASYEPGESTVAIEFARGGPEGVAPPLPPPHGYAFSLPFLSPDILRRASILYVWVTPEESRRRNRDRARPGPEGDASILHHGVPDVVLHEEYGGDDLLWLAANDDGSVAVTRDGATYRLPVAVFDNRTDHTSFLRADPSLWDTGAVAALHAELTEAFAHLR